MKTLLRLSPPETRVAAFSIPFPLWDAPGTSFKCGPNSMVNYFGRPGWLPWPSFERLVNYKNNGCSKSQALRQGGLRFPGRLLNARLVSRNTPLVPKGTVADLSLIFHTHIFQSRYKSESPTIRPTCSERNANFSFPGSLKRA